MTKSTFRVEASIDDATGRVVAVYLRVREGKVAETKEIKDGFVYADYDAQSLLLGVELLGPCELEVLERVAEGESESVRRFLRGGAPRELIPA